MHAFKHPQVNYGSARELRLEASSALGFEADGELVTAMPACREVYVSALASALTIIC